MAPALQKPSSVGFPPRERLACHLLIRHQEGKLLNFLPHPQTFSAESNYITVVAEPENARNLFATVGRDSATIARFREDFLQHGGRP